MVIWVVPEPVTLLVSVTSICSKVLSSEVSLMVMLPDSASTASLKLSTMLALTATPLALSAGTELERVGLVESIAAEGVAAFEGSDLTDSLPPVSAVVTL